MRHKGILYLGNWQCFVYLALLFSLSGCCSLFCSPTPEAPCPIDGLLLKANDLPGKVSDWFESGSRSSKSAPKRIGVERIGTSFVGEGLFDGIIHDIYRFEDERAAYRDYVDAEDEVFSVQNYQEIWHLPSELSSIQLSAVNQRIGCNIYKDSGAEECDLLAQYGPYLVKFSIRQHGLQYSEVVPVIDEIEKRMVQCISPK